MKSIHAFLRLAALAVNVMAGVLTVLFLFPFLDQAGRGRCVTRWSRRLLAALEVRLEVHGQPPPVRGKGALIVANHISWLDIHVVHSILPARFISKAEVRDWPVVGWLADKAGGTLFLERTSKADAKRMNEHMAGYLRVGDCLALFPEGTTSDGRGLLPFYASLFQPAVEAEAQVWPACIRYLGTDDSINEAAAYYGDTSLMTSLRRIAKEPRIRAEIRFLPPISAKGLHRRDLSAQAEAVIRALLPSAAGAPGTAPETREHLQDDRP